MHGVATPFLLRAFDIFGFPSPDLCTEQKDPDPEFPTVPFPNPEEKGEHIGRSYRSFGFTALGFATRVSLISPRTCVIQ